MCEFEKFFMDAVRESELLGLGSSAVTLFFAPQFVKIRDRPVYVL